jgi:hypothetical protein
MRVFGWFRKLRYAVDRTFLHFFTPFFRKKTFVVGTRQNFDPGQATVRFLRFFKVLGVKKKFSGCG